MQISSYELVAFSESIILSAALTYIEVLWLSRSHKRTKPLGGWL